MSEQHEVNPLQKKLSPAQFNASVKFYEADHQLEPADREQLASDLKDVVTWTSLAGYGAGMAGFFGPTLYRRVGQRLPVPYGRLVHKPFWSFFLGLSTMLVAHQLVGRLQFNSHISQLEQDSSRLRQLSVWRAMDFHQAGLFYLYYRQLAADPSFILKDPRQYTEHDVVFHPPAKPLEDDEVGPLWDRVRREHGFEEAADLKPLELSAPRSAWDKLRDSK